MKNYLRENEFKFLFTKIMWSVINYYPKIKRQNKIINYKKFETRTKLRGI